MTEDPKGRLDILLRRLAREVCARIEAQTGGDLWEQGGVRQFVDEKIEQLKIPTQPIDLPATLCRNVLGVLRRRRKIQHSNWLPGQKPHYTKLRRRNRV